MLLENLKWVWLKSFFSAESADLCWYDSVSILTINTTFTVHLCCLVIVLPSNLKEIIYSGKSCERVKQSCHQGTESHLKQVTGFVLNKQECNCLYFHGGSWSGATPLGFSSRIVKRANSTQKVFSQDLRLGLPVKSCEVLTSLTPQS